MREEMRSLAKSIVASHDARAIGLASIRRDVASQLKELDGAHNAMAQQLQGDLSQAESARKQDEAQRARERAQADRQRKSEVRTWMEEVAAAHSAAREEWQNLTVTMRAKRAGGVGVAEAPAPMPPAEAAVEEEAVEVGEVTAEFAALSTRVFAHLSSHSDGTRLSELEREFGLGRLQAARVVRHLMSEGKAKKEGLLYFAT